MGKIILIVILILAFGAVLFVINKDKVAEAPTPVELETLEMDIEPLPAGEPDEASDIPEEQKLSPAPTPTPTPTPAPAPAPTPTTRVFDVNITADGVSPQILTVKVGDTVRFTNNSNILRWPASDPHPTHNICPGFDAGRGLSNGEVYSYTFNTARECPYHDHLNFGDSRFQGEIIVTE